jgi:hypothetical protein
MGFNKIVVRGILIVLVGGLLTGCNLLKPKTANKASPAAAAAAAVQGAASEQAAATDNKKAPRNYGVTLPGVAVAGSWSVPSQQAVRDSEGHIVNQRNSDLLGAVRSTIDNRNGYVLDLSMWRADMPSYTMTLAVQDKNARESSFAYMPLGAGSCTHGENCHPTCTLSVNASVQTCPIPACCDIQPPAAPGCYTANQQILTPSGFAQIGDMEVNLAKDVIALDPEATIDSLSWKPVGIAYFTLDNEAFVQPVMTIITQSGVRLAVTPGHPMINALGDAQPAESMAIGDLLVRPDGSLDAIVSIFHQNMLYQSMNLDTDTNFRSQKVIVAGDNGGVLVGARFLQDHDLARFGRVIARDRESIKLFDDL